jgi:hypothetical protein
MSFLKNKNKSFIVILPNLKYKDDKIIFHSKNELKLNVHNHTLFKKDFFVGNLELSSQFHIDEYLFKCRIYEEELDNGLKVHIFYQNKNNNHENIDKGYMKKISKIIESKILGIDFEDDFGKSNEYENNMESIENKNEEFYENHNYEEYDHENEHNEENEYNEYNEENEYNEYNEENEENEFVKNIMYDKIIY